MHIYAHTHIQTDRHTERQISCLTLYFTMKHGKVCPELTQKSVTDFWGQYENFAPELPISCMIWGVLLCYFFDIST